MAEWAAHAAALVLVTGALLLLARLTYARLSGYDLEHQLTVADNPAVGVSLFGYLGGTVLLLAGLLVGQREVADPLIELAHYAVHGLAGLLLLRIAGLVNDRLILHGVENRKELVDDHNVGAGAVLCGSYLASGLILAGAFAGRTNPALVVEDVGHVELWLRELGVAAAFFGLGQVVLVLYGQLYQRLVGYDVRRAIAEDYEHQGRRHGGNAAAGAAFGGNLLALGLVLFGATHHDFAGWTDGLTAFGIAAAAGLVLLPLWRVFVDRVLLGKANLAEEIFRDRNLNAALLETAALLGLGTALAVVL